MSAEAMDTLTIIPGDPIESVKNYNPKDRRKRLSRVLYSAANSAELVPVPRSVLGQWGRLQFFQAIAAGDIPTCAPWEKADMPTCLGMAQEFWEDEYKKIRNKTDKKVIDAIVANRYKIALLLNTSGGALSCSERIRGLMYGALERYAFGRKEVASAGMDIMMTADPDRQFIESGTKLMAHLSEYESVLPPEHPERIYGVKSLRKCLLDRVVDYRDELDRRLEALNEKVAKDIDFTDKDAERFWGFHTVGDATTLAAAYVCTMKPELITKKATGAFINNCELTVIRDFIAD